MESIGQVLKRLAKEGRPAPQPCEVCGDLTRDRYFGRPLCCPYNEDGRIVKRCKWIVGEQLEKGRPPKFPATGDTIPF